MYFFKMRKQYDIIMSNTYGHGRINLGLEQSVGLCGQITLNSSEIDVDAQCTINSTAAVDYTSY